INVRSHPRPTRHAPDCPVRLVFAKGAGPRCGLVWSLRCGVRSMCRGETWHAPFRRVIELAAGTACSSRSPSRDVRATPCPVEREKGWQMPIVETARLIVGGVDTHLDVHVAAVVDGTGGVLGVRSFSTTPAGYHALSGWLASFGSLERVG